MDQVKALFYLPLRDNDGRELSAEIEMVRAEIYVRFAGWTFLGYDKGAFQIIDGSQTIDESAAYVVILDKARIAELEEVLLEFKSKTLQEAIYLEIHRTIDVRFI